MGHRSESQCRASSLSCVEQTKARVCGWEAMLFFMNLLYRTLSNFVHSDLMLNLHRGRLDDERKSHSITSRQIAVSNRLASDSRRHGIVDRRTGVERVRRVFFVMKVRARDARLYVPCE